jgi:hypothetical protein
MTDLHDRGSDATTNYAWQRLHGLIDEHFTVVAWTTDDQTPVLASLIEPATGDAVTIAIVDMHTHRQPHALLAVSTAVAVTGHGPFGSARAARRHGRHVAATDAAVAATRPVPLHHPDLPELVDDAWTAIPDVIAAHLRPGHVAEPGRTLLLLLDRTRGRIAAVGPFPDTDTAIAWQPADPRPDVAGRAAPTRTRSGGVMKALERRPPTAISRPSPSSTRTYSQDPVERMVP